MQLRIVPSESTDSYFLALQGYLATHGCCPVAFYSDKHCVFQINRDAQGGSDMAQFGRALAELNIEIICANSSQAQASLNALQDRLVKELRLANVCDFDIDNGFLERLLPAARPENLHRPLTVRTLDSTTSCATVNSAT